jgi:enediyne biosynthesis protein E4
MCWTPRQLIRLVLVAAGATWAGCGAAGTSDATRAADPGRGSWFRDATTESGLAFRHVNGMRGQFYYPEIIAPGVALFDFDTDGDLDVFLAQGGSLDARTADGQSDGGRLFRNEGVPGSDGRVRVTFTDVTAASRIRATEYGMGAAVGDYDNDGCPDLYLTTLGRNQLWRNNCDGTFTETARGAGVADVGWSVSAAFLDFDRDGWLDLYVGHYLDWTPASNAPCFGASGARTYCAPRVYRPQPSRLYRNRGDGTFTDVTTAAGLAARFGPALGVSTADFNGDGWIDFYVANDGEENQLWLNRHDGTFTDAGLLSGVALSEQGKAKAGMGVDAGDVDDDGDEDLVVTNLTGEGHDLYLNDGTGTFDSRAAAWGLRYPTLPYTGFGAGWIDADNDGWLDLLTVNGTVQRIDAQVREKDPLPLRQRKQLFRNTGSGQLEDVSARAGPAFETLDVGRGAAFGDLDDDGDTDVVVGNNGGAPQVLVNTSDGRHHWIGLRLVARDAAAPGGRPRDVPGARVVVMRDGQPARRRRAHADGSYASANDPRVLVGLGASAAAPRVRVEWPDGRAEEWANLPVDRYSTLVKGTGR